MSPNLRGGGAQGPTDDEFENTRIIGRLQADKAQQLFDSATEVLAGPIDARGRYVDFSGDRRGRRGTRRTARPHRTCPGALGQNFTAGAEDGPGPPIVEEGDLSTNPLLLVAGIVVNPTPAAVRACQAPKQVFLGSGSQNPPWTPQVMPVQVLRIGQLAIGTAPGEFTIVAGQRVLDAVQRASWAGRSRASDPGRVRQRVRRICGHAGGVRRAELRGRGDPLRPLHRSRRTRRSWPSSPPRCATVSPRRARCGRRRWRSSRISVRPRVVLDTPPLGRSVRQRAHPAGRVVPARAREVRADFVTGHPNNNLRNEGTFVEVQRPVNGAVDDGRRRTATGRPIYRWKREYLERLHRADHLDHPGRRAAGHLPDRAPRRREGPDRPDLRVHRGQPELHRGRLRSARRLTLGPLPASDGHGARRSGRESLDPAILVAAARTPRPPRGGRGRALAPAMRAEAGARLVRAAGDLPGGLREHPDAGAGG